MNINTQTQYLNFKSKLSEWLTHEVTKTEQAPYVVFISYGDREARCKVWSSCSNEAATVKKRALNYLDKMFEKNKKLPEFLKFDLAYNIEKKTWQEIDVEVNKQPHNNHYRKGISFDEKFEINFLEQEIYGRALIKGIVYNQPNFWDEKNINDTIKIKYPNLNKTIHLSKLENVWVFDTIATIYESGELISLHSAGQFNGVRSIHGDKKDHIRSLVQKNAEFLYHQIQDDGKFIYGYFPAYNRLIKSYNTVRHCTSLYALIETFEVIQNPSYWPKIILGIEYALTHFYRETDANTAYMIDGEGDKAEVKLGANAAAIMMLSKYHEITADSKYLSYAEKIARGIQNMVDPSGETQHVLHYPSLELKEKFRIVYYDGEAALGLLRLYQINHDEALLATVKLMFDHFITKNYEKYHDHWLSYCVNELTKLCPEVKYYQFGLNNYLKHMRFIKERKTAYSTFLEMMMSAYKMVNRLKEQEQHSLLEQAHFEELKELIELRTEYQRTGFFYPEVAMYMANPGEILNAFYVRHDRLRTRIDDQEHNLSGYVAYVNHFD